MTSPKKPKEKHVSAREAARRIERARQMLYEARCLLASSYRGRNAPPHVFEGIWRKAHEMREEHRDRIESTRGVVGHGLGYRFKNGRETKEPCVVVFVRRKVDPQELKQLHRRRIPEELRKGRFGVGTDVIEIDSLIPQAGGQIDGHGSIGPLGRDIFGTIGAIASDLDTGRNVAITAMHVTGLDSFPSGTTPSSSFSAPGHVFDPNAPDIGLLTGGETVGIDAAKIEIRNMDALLPALPSILPGGARPISNDVNAAVRLFGASSGRVLDGVIKFVGVDIFHLRQTILATVDTIEGDSGAGLVDNSNLLLGILFGRASADFPSTLRVFSSASEVLKTLRCQI